MLKITLLIVALFAMTAMVMSGGTDSICDRYSTLLKLNNTALMTTFVTTAFGRLLEQDITNPYFTGKIGADSSNRTIDYTTNSTALGNLAGELVAFFGGALGCTDADFPAYTGDDNMANVHKNNKIDRAAFEVFNQQLVNIAQVLGFNHTDYDTLATVLESFRPEICTQADCNTGSHTIFVGSGGNFYTPSAGYSFPAGTSITWIWSSNATSHSVTQDTGLGNCTRFTNGFDSTVLTGASGQKNYTRTFDTAGTYYWFCTVGTHCRGGMYGQITITAAASSTAATTATTAASTATTAASTATNAATTAATSISSTSKNSGAATVFVSMALLAVALLF